jgi:FixJ family two-component response regulator
MSAKNSQHLVNLESAMRRAQQLDKERAETIAQVESLVEEAKNLRGHTKSLYGKPSIYVVDSDTAFCTSAVRLLSNAGFQVRIYSTAEEFLRDNIADAPGCILMDLHLPGGSGLELQSTLAHRGSPLPIIFISAEGNIPTVVRAMKAGAMDFLVKPVEFEILLEAVNRALAFFRRQQQQKQQLTRWQSAFQTLSHREAEVFELVTAGKMNKEIASDLGITLRTVKAHRGHVMVKMQVASLAELVRIADSLPPTASTFKPSV